MFAQTQDRTLAQTQDRVLAQVQAQETTLSDIFYKEIKQQSGKIKTIECSFSQTKQLPYLKAPAQTIGKFYCQNNNIAIEYDKPKGDCVIMTEQQCKTIVNGKTNIININSHPALKQLHSIILYSISGDIESMKKMFDIQISLSEKEYHLTLIPKQKSIREKAGTITLWFDKKDFSLSFLKTEKSSDDYVLYKFFDKKFNTSINEEHFNL
ncbi:MAG: outer membrane lipoprotein carrier protein LolA [Bacteroidales bacterium]|jgi:outer membrane lipoprotein-sorting protein|nr:outer membrane lipoprotein carrier protein LolA [Bacteroidales bacterium]